MSKGTMSRGIRAAVMLVVAAGLLAGCKTTGKQAGKPDAMTDLAAQVKPEARFKVATDPNAGFFRYSPQQASGPDQHIPKDTKVELLSRLAGFSKVKLLNGNIGFMDTADLVHLSPKEIADEDAAFAAKQAAAAQAVAAANVSNASSVNNANIGNGGNYNPPPEAGHSQPLPVADPILPATPPPPGMFHY